VSRRKNAAATHHAPEPSAPSTPRFVMVDLDELDARMERACERALAKQASKAPAPRASDRLTLAEFCEAYRCSVRTAQRMIKAGDLRIEKRTDGGSSRVFVQQSELDRHLAASKARK
jgi:hypothetical protein